MICRLGMNVYLRKIVSDRPYLTVSIGLLILIKRATLKIQNKMLGAEQVL